jgi:hypothetical protein
VLARLNAIFNEEDAACAYELLQRSAKGAGVETLLPPYRGSLPCTQSASKRLAVRRCNTVEDSLLLVPLSPPGLSRFPGRFLALVLCHRFKSLGTCTARP